MSEQSDLRERFGKLIGMCGSSSAGERDNALAAIDRALSAAGLTWAWLSDLVASGERPDSGLVQRRALLVAKLLKPRLNEALSLAWSMTADEAKAIAELRKRVESGADLNSAEGLERIERAIGIITDVKRRNGRAA